METNENTAKFGKHVFNLG